MPTQSPALRERLIQQVREFAARETYVHFQDPWMVAHREHLRLHLPTRYAMLVEERSLDLMCSVVAATAAERYSDLVEEGVSPDQARVIAQEEIVFLTSEEDLARTLAVNQELRQDAQEEQAAQIVQALRR